MLTKMSEFFKGLSKYTIVVLVSNNFLKVDTFSFMFVDITKQGSKCCHVAEGWPITR